LFPGKKIDRDKTPSNFQKNKFAFMMYNIDLTCRRRTPVSQESACGRGRSRSPVRSPAQRLLEGVPVLERHLPEKKKQVN
jgi:hypothetical protein